MEQRRDHALQQRQVRTGLGPQPVTAGQLALTTPDPAGLSAAAAAGGGRASGTKVGGAEAVRACCSASTA
ncbi:hypothetical protein ABEV34_29840, partial [Methylorubrum rhodesianum]|uniref:hypothetical protein n=1 Tax=Methylorubrum rhodesianum TaxID=29427 RepID=UPI003D2E990D